jgi:hypothetical protein
MAFRPTSPVLSRAKDLRNRHNVRSGLPDNFVSYVEKLPLALKNR